MGGCVPLLLLAQSGTLARSRIECRGRLVVDGEGSAPVLVSRSLAKLVVDWLDLDWRTLAVVYVARALTR